MSITYIGARIGMFILVVWLATTVIFFLPRIASDRNPVRERLVMMAATGNLATGMEKVVAAYEQEYGLDQPLYLQYIRYLSSLVRGDLNYSLINYPTRVWDMIVQRMPYTLGLVGVSVLTAFALGSLSGATLAWPGAPKWLKGALPIFLTLSPIPYFMLAIMLMFLFAVRHQWQPEWWPLLPLAGATSVTTVYDGWNMARILDTIHHSILPALSIILSQIGFWALGMRGMMVTTQGEDYVTLAQMRGLKPSRVFSLYGMRNATLPQLTSLALAMSLIFSGVILVEVIYRYPGMGTLLYNAIAGFDYFVIYGVVFVLIVMVAASTFILDIVYPFIDPRVRRAA